MPLIQWSYTQRREWFIICSDQSTLGLDYTAEMEKAMHQSHGMSYAEYERDHDLRMKVELKREQSYRDEKRQLAKMNIRGY
ncbi:hypothetical protein B2I20_08200 [Bacillus stratosphericus]|nr:hypothetical protein VT48_15170 [Bacillus altitudinis]MBW3702399.1 hypothetical protein [Bacillus aerophilus]OQP21221.1 hypothetical protein B2I20_08200 [Bacillus stratosphericus]